MPAAASPEAIEDDWTLVAVDGTRKVISEDVLVGFFADPIGTFNSLTEWPSYLLVVRTSALPDLHEGDARLESIARSDVLREFHAEVVTAPDVEFAWKQMKAIANAANSTKPPLPNGPTGGY